ncbi:MAG: hypothetical protein R3C53_26710 [Pirellulaceae bacterium]
MNEANTNTNTNTNTDGIVAELASVIDDIECFLDGFCERVELALDIDHASVDLDLTDEAWTLNAQHTDWETEKRRVENGIREQLDLLAAAWLRLEEEQQSFLQMKNAHATELTRRSESHPVAVTAVSDLVPVSQHNSRRQHMAVQEFQRLRQEIQSRRSSHSDQRDQP